MKKITLHTHPVRHMRAIASSATAGSLLGDGGSHVRHMCIAAAAICALFSAYSHLLGVGAGKGKVERKFEYARLENNPDLFVKEYEKSMRWKGLERQIETARRFIPHEKNALWEATVLYAASKYITEKSLPDFIPLLVHIVPKGDFWERMANSPTSEGGAARAAYVKFAAKVVEKPGEYKDFLPGLAESFATHGKLITEPRDMLELREGLKKGTVIPKKTAGEEIEKLKTALKDQFAQRIADFSKEGKAIDIDSLRPLLDAETAGAVAEKLDKGHLKDTFIAIRDAKKVDDIKNIVYGKKDITKKMIKDTKKILEDLVPAKKLFEEERPETVWERTQAIFTELDDLSQNNEWAAVIKETQIDRSIDYLSEFFTLQLDLAQKTLEKTGYDEEKVSKTRNFIEKFWYQIRSWWSGRAIRELNTKLKGMQSEVIRKLNERIKEFEESKEEKESQLESNRRFKIVVESIDLSKPD